MKNLFKRLIAGATALLLVTTTISSAFAATGEKHSSYTPDRQTQVLCGALGDDTPELPENAVRGSEPAAAPAAFVDVNSDAWYAEYVAYVSENGLMKGVSADVFAPESPVNRAQVATVLYRMAGEPEVTSDPGFTDLKDNWYKTAVAWAKEAGVANGTSAETFAPKLQVTREQLVTMIWRYAGSEKIAIDKLAAFEDAEKVSTWAVDALNWAVAKGIINGKGTVIDPKGSTKRCELAAILYRFQNPEHHIEMPVYLLYNRANQAVIGNKDDAGKSCISIKEAVEEDGFVSIEGNNLGKLFAADNGDGTITLVKEKDYVYNGHAFVIANNAEGNTCYTEEWDDAASYYVTEVNGGIVLKNKANGLCLAMKDGVLAAAEYAEDDADFVFIMSIVVSYTRADDRNWRVTAALDPKDAQNPILPEPIANEIGTGTAVMLYNPSTDCIVARHHTGGILDADPVKREGDNLILSAATSGLYHAVNNGDGYWYFADTQFCDRFGILYYLSIGEGDACFSMSWDEYAMVKPIAVEGGYLMQSQADGSYMAVKDGSVLCVDDPTDDPSCIWQAVVYTDTVEGDEETDGYRIGTITDGFFG